jgi:ABC-type transport system involved in multi-copper enzyme maturation permease subunit
MIVSVLKKELQVWLRRPATFGLYTLMVLATGGIVVLGTATVLSQGVGPVPALFSTGVTSTSGVNALLTAYRALWLFLVGALCLLLAASMVAPAIASAAFQGEREAGTYDLLLATGVSPLALVLGKLGGAAAFVLLLLGTALPVFAAAWLFGGVTPTEAGPALLVVGMSVLLFAALGVFFSTFVPSSLAAALYAYLVINLMTLGTAAIYLVAASVRMGDTVAPLVYLNPYLAVLAASDPLRQDLSGLLPLSQRALLPAPPQQVLGMSLTLPHWAATSGLYALASVALIAASAIILDPLHPLKTRRVRAWKGSPTP